ncbi:hypothetical protein M0R04_10100 [Candidatus Dojkabacteria bacterium]|jgi:hypothetical protein|nr:hypothetical protein [Candidatus Dojkabacteria bacterium]
MICSKCKTKETDSTSGMCWWCINNATVINVKTIMPAYKIQDGLNGQWLYKTFFNAGTGSTPTIIEQWSTPDITLTSNIKI